jgi:predicted RNase H-like HicB family nuclease
MKYLVVIEKMGNNYGAYSPDVDGCVATGATIKETIQRMTEALELHLEGEEEIVPKGMDFWLERIETIAHSNAIIIEIGVGNEIVGTKEAFQSLISQRGIYKKLGVDRSTVANWKTYLTEDKISNEKMEEMLNKAGWKVVSQSVWESRKSLFFM